MEMIVGLLIGVVIGCIVTAAISLHGRIRLLRAIEGLEAVMKRGKLEKESKTK